MPRPLPPLIDIAAGRPAEARVSLVASAVEHRMTGLLLTAYQAGRIDLPDEDVTSLVAADLATAARHTELWGVLTLTLQRLAEIGIEALAIKGVTNERRWYARTGERPCSDVDIVLAPHCVDRVDEALAVLAPHLPFIEEATALVRQRRLQHVHFTLSDASVDLHLDPLKLGMWTRQPELWWSTTRTVAAPDSTEVRVLAPEIALVSALTHLNKDRFAYLGAYAEVALIMDDADLDWARLVGFVEAEGLDVPVWASLTEVVDRLGLRPPRALPDPGGWQRRLWEGVWPAERRLGGDDARSRGRKRQLMIPVTSRGRSGDAVAEFRRSLLPPRGLFAVHADGAASGHGYLRRVSIDRLVGAAREAQRGAPGED
ncbi:MAG: nucleotidyltransferase family protein [Acidimicrobiales bacterium]